MKDIVPLSLALVLGLGTSKLEFRRPFSPPRYGLILRVSCCGYTRRAKVFICGEIPVDFCICFPECSVWERAEGAGWGDSPD